MPPAQPGKPAPKGGKKIAGLPVWAWGLALAGGLLIGFVFLRRNPSQSDQGEAQRAEGPAEDAAGGAVVQPLDDETAQALGLTPSTQPHYGAGAGAGAGAGGGGGDLTASDGRTGTVGTIGDYSFSSGTRTGSVSTGITPGVVSPAGGRTGTVPTGIRL